MAKKGVAKKEKKDLDVRIKVNNLEKALKEANKCKKNSCHCGGFGFWGFGSALAMILSYTQNSSIFWAILHGIISWIYVIYRIVMMYV